MIRKKMLSVMLIMLMLMMTVCLSGCKETEIGESDWEATGGEPVVNKQEKPTENIYEFGVYPQSKADETIQGILLGNVTVDAETGLWNEYISENEKARYDTESGYYIYIPIVDGKEQPMQRYMDCDGTLYLVEPIKWVKIATEGSNSVLISLDLIDGGRTYNDTYVECTWSDSSMRDWLNGINDYDNENGVKYNEQYNFIDRAFSEAEISKIKTVANTCADNEKYGTVASGVTTNDSVYLLSFEEYSKYFTEDSGINSMAYATDYAIARGVVTGTEGAANWWLRDVGSSLFMLGVDRIGVVSEGGFSIQDGDVGIRPVITVETAALK